VHTDRVTDIMMFDCRWQGQRTVFEILKYIDLMKDAVCAQYVTNLQHVLHSHIVSPASVQVYGNNNF